MEEKIRSYIEENLLEGSETIESDSPLYTSGLLSSMAHLKLINYLESTFDISIPGDKISLDNFDTLGQIAGFTRQLKESGAA
ncbi:MAG: hypothetical protein GF344_19075 [Chitinivibrionales bacterium]|nr:hypothetical protein [Chitinivibrionales bacterium]